MLFTHKLQTHYNHAKIQTDTGRDSFCPFPVSPDPIIGKKVFLLRYYAVSDVHGFYSLLMNALKKAGFFTDPEPRKLILLGDLFDRGSEALLLQDFVLERMEADDILLIRGNHEDLFWELITEDKGLPCRHHVSNGTFDTLLQLTDFSQKHALEDPQALCRAGLETPYIRRIMTAMKNYWETEHYIFVHGWIPCLDGLFGYEPISEWRQAGTSLWYKARWINGMDAVQTTTEEKTVVCGHWHASYGHSVLERKGPEFGPGADFSPYSAPGILAIDGCTSYSGRVNCVVLEDNPLPGSD